MQPAWETAFPPQPLAVAQAHVWLADLHQPPALVERLRQWLSDDEHEHALLALALGREIGVDLEYANPLDDADLVAEHFFSPAERAILRALTSEEKQAAFYRCWARKEAVIKAVELGLTMPLDDFDVALAPGKPARLLAIRGDAAPADAWTLADLPPLPGYACALASNALLSEIFCWRLIANLDIL